MAQDPDDQPEGEVPEGSEAPVETEAQTEVTAEGETPAQTEVPEEPKQTPWFTRRIDELTGKWRGAERQLEAANTRAAQLEAMIRQGQQPQGQTQPQPQAMTQAQLTQAQIQAEAQKLAAEQVQTQAFNDACNSVADAGKAQYADFNTVIANYANLGGLNEQFVRAALETDAAPQVIYHLGKDLDKAAEIMALPPLKQAVALARLADKLKAPKAVSKAPAPIEPIGSRGSSGDKNPENMTTEQWMKWREKEAKDRRRA